MYLRRNTSRELSFKLRHKKKLVLDSTTRTIIKQDVRNDRKDAKERGRYNCSEDRD